MRETTPLVTGSRDALVAGLRETISPGAYDPGDIADYLLESGVVRAVDGLADDETLVMAAEVATARAFMEVHPDLPSDERVALSVLRALAAALTTPTNQPTTR